MDVTLSIEAQSVNCSTLKLVRNVTTLFGLPEGKKKESLSAVFSGFQQIQTDRRGK